ncbi:MAG TPA: metallophosphoesterase family protein [Usitatibacter sp.]|nr:metallophosphoesterase family protein [Usitatibacter sp.]
MTRRLAALLAALALAGCAGREPRSDVFSFAVMGDTPYSAAEEKRFVAMIARLDAEDLAFVVHVGDIKGGEPCTDEIYLRRRAQFDRSAHPFFYTPGDNEWTDCRGVHGAPRDPIERLQRIRQVFFAGDESLGRRRITAKSQRACMAPLMPECGCGALPENRAWTIGPVHFVTLDVAGSDNNEGYDAANDREARCRNEGNRQWLERAVAEAAAPEVRALVVMVQANPWFIIRKPGVFDGFLAGLRAGAERLRKPLLLVHGDTHMYRADRPFVDGFGAPLPFLSRLETYGSPFVGWVRVTVDPSKSDLFSFEDHLFAVVP